MLRNGEDADLTVSQIAAHLGVKTWNVTRELQLGKTNPARLQGAKVLGARMGVGRGGQWRVKVKTYLDWLQIPEEDRTRLGPDGLPELIPFEMAAGRLGIAQPLLLPLVRQQRLAHIEFGRTRYFTHNQQERLSVLLKEDYQEATPGGGPGPGD
jgi:hypothetical protein